MMISSIWIKDFLPVGWLVGFPYGTFIMFLEEKTSNSKVGASLGISSSPQPRAGLLLHSSETCVFPIWFRYFRIG